jgi:general secretion pathway protein K
MKLGMEMRKRAKTVQSAIEPAVAGWKMTNDETLMTREFPPRSLKARKSGADFVIRHSVRPNYPKFPGNGLLKAGQRVPLASERGIAIIIVMVSIFVLAVLAGGFAYSMKVETKLAMNSNNETEMEWLGRSGVELARYVLAQEMNIPSTPYDALNQKWAGGPGGGAETNDALANVTLENNTLGHGKFSVKITDLERKYNINLAWNSPEVLQHALIMMGADASDIPTIVACIQDWIDKDDDTHINGAESDYYQTLDPPYSAKNGPIDDLSELLFIKGITPEMYWGSFSTNHPATLFQSRQPAHLGLPSNIPTYTVGLVDIFTPISNGTININTASVTALQMIPGVDENVAQEIRRLRSGPDGVEGTEDDVPLSNVGELINAGLSPQAVSSISRFCGVRSSTFEVKVDVEIGMSKRRYVAIVRRNTPKDIPILNFHWEY